MKVKEFWDIMCNDLEFRFYSGTPIAEFKRIFDTMNPDIMHYIPTINEEIALGMTAGVYLSGVKGAIFMSSSYFDKLKYNIEYFNKIYSIPVLFIVENTSNPLKLKQFNITSLDKMDNYLYKEAFTPAILVIEEGDLQ